MFDSHDTTRRTLLKKMAALPIASAASPLAMQMLGMANAAAQSAQDYKALVCVFLFGGNDHYNTVVPYDTGNHDAYYAVRKGTAIANSPYEGIALTRSSLSNTALPTTGLPSGMQMALGPTMGAMKTLFESGRAGIVLNVGPLVVPTNKAQYTNKGVPLPPKLFSHNDQTAYWQTCGSTEGGTSGWGGRTADLILSRNSKASLSCVSVTGNTVFLSGGEAFGYQISTSGATTINAIRSRSLFGSRDCADALSAILAQDSSHLLESEHKKVMKRALDTYGDVSTAIGSAPGSNLTSRFPSSGSNALSSQLLMVARLLEKRVSLGQTRQVFMVGMGGFDLHDFLPTQHPALLQKISDAFKEFNDALVHLGLENNVSTFTASDFGRTLSSNGDGSDHGWGSHHFIMGGAVNGGRFFGRAPTTGLTHDQQVGSGRLLPSTSVEQTTAEMARWFGVSDSDMSTVLPNASNFDLHTLGLFK